MILLCRAHHTTVHEGEWTITLDPVTNTVTATHPNGRRHTSQPHTKPP
jgi:hypothetical protein